MEINRVYWEKMGKQAFFWEEENFDWESYLFLRERLMTTCMFYGELLYQDKEVAYYGDAVTAGDLQLPLMRWKVSDDQYRIIFDDLSIRNAGSAQLAELEAELDKMKQIKNNGHYWQATSNFMLTY